MIRCRICHRDIRQVGRIDAFRALGNEEAVCYQCIRKAVQKAHELPLSEILRRWGLER